MSTLAGFQAASGAAAAVVMPLYRQVREVAPALEPVTPAFEVVLGARAERARVFRVARRNGGADVFFVEHDRFFDRVGMYSDGGADYADNALRFAFFCRAAVQALPEIAPAAAVLHAHDWHAALAPVYLRTELARDRRFTKLATVLSVHNAAYQGHFAPETMDDLGLPWHLFNWRTLEWYGRVNLLKGGIAFADAVVTVSPTHGEELQTPDGGFGLHDTFSAVQDRLTGILNGIDLEAWNPATDPLLAAPFSAADLSGKQRCKAALQRAAGLPARPEVPVVAMCARLTDQKGIDLVLDVLPNVVGAQCIIVGEGEAHYGAALQELATRYPDRVSVDVTFRDTKEHVLLGGADMVLMPSRFEPCGLTQMRAQRYGTIPIARRVGGLADTIRDGATGFLFDDCSVPGLAGAIRRALGAYADPRMWEAYVRAAMAQCFSWEHSVRRYGEVYRGALRRSATPRDTT